MTNKKIIINQVLPRRFGNDIRTCQPWGDRNTNGCGKMDSFTPHALHNIASLGITHIWYTGIIEHATRADYTIYGIKGDCPEVVKGMAGSPYAIRDYYDVDPDLATSVPARMEEFEALVERTHDEGLGVIIDFVPNHVARQYHSDAKPEGTPDLGERDDTAQAFSPQNNFYYIPYDELHASDFNLGAYHERPAKATGNDNFSSWVSRNDWYETAKLNYGVDYASGRQPHFDPVPPTWKQMLAILLHWASKGVDGFRCDMAEMVPVEFWRWAITQVKAKHPGTIFIAEVYNPSQYRNYINNGHFDYLYDKVGMYDCLRAVVCAGAQASDITLRWQETADIRPHMLNFLENHDEQRLASDFFAGNASKGRAPLMVSACMGSNPMMIYFGQELGERGMDTEGFSGRDGRTSIYDYWMVDSIRRWRNEGTFNNRQLSPAEVYLQQFYSKVLTLCNQDEVLREGEFYDLMYANLRNPDFNTGRQYAFIRRKGNQLVLVVANFDEQDVPLAVNIPRHLFDFYSLPERDDVKVEGLMSNSYFHFSFNSRTPTRVIVPALNGRLLKFSL